MQIKLQSCGDCRFFDDEASSKENRGRCRRYPRQATVIGEKIYWFYPEVDQFDGCGEWYPLLDERMISAHTEEI